MEYVEWSRFTLFLIFQFMHELDDGKEIYHFIDEQWVNSMMIEHSWVFFSFPFFFFLFFLGLSALFSPFTCSLSKLVMDVKMKFLIQVSMRHPKLFNHWISCPYIPFDHCSSCGMWDLGIFGLISENQQCTFPTCERHVILYISVKYKWFKVLWNNNRGLNYCLYIGYYNENSMLLNCRFFLPKSQSHTNKSLIRYT